MLVRALAKSRSILSSLNAKSSSPVLLSSTSTFNSSACSSVDTSNELTVCYNCIQYHSQYMQYSTGIDFLTATKSTLDDKHAHKPKHHKSWYIPPNHRIYSFGEGVVFQAIDSILTSARIPSVGSSQILDFERAIDVIIFGLLRFR